MWKKALAGGLLALVFALALVLRINKIGLWNLTWGEKLFFGAGTISIVIMTRAFVSSYKVTKKLSEQPTLTPVQFGEVYFPDSTSRAHLASQAHS